MSHPLTPAWAEPLTRFLTYLKVERAYSAHTIKQYQRQLQSVAEAHLDEYDSWFTLDAEALRAYSMWLRSKGLNSRSIAAAQSALRSFYKFACHRLPALCQHDPSATLKTPKIKKPLPKNLDVDQVNQLLNMPDDDPLAARDLAMMELMYSCGLRASELVGANLQDINLKQREIRVWGKGNKERLLPVTKKAVAAIQVWLRFRDAFARQDEPALFLSKQKNRISQRQVAVRIKQWGLKQGMSSDVYPHKLRHSFASHMLESSGDLRAVQELLGHSSLSATQVYTHLDFQHLAKVYDSAHPRARKKSRS